MKLTCDCCGKEVNLNNLGSITRGIEKTITCNACNHEDTVNAIKYKYYVETYKNNNIYLKDGKYFPYWECRYYFTSLEDVKKRIVNNHIAIV